MFNEWYKSEGCHLDFPRGGSQAIINALVRCGLTYGLSLWQQLFMCITLCIT